MKNIKEFQELEEEPQVDIHLGLFKAANLISSF